MSNFFARAGTIDNPPLWSSFAQDPNPIQQDHRRSIIILVVIENALLDCRVASCAPAVKPFDGRGAGRVRVPPLEPEELGKGLDRMVTRRPHGQLLHYTVEI